MNKNPDRIQTGTKVAVIGGGPAGSFFALYLLCYARERNSFPEVTIYEQRDFDSTGPKGCKGCAGVLSPSLVKNLDELGLSIPEGVIKSRIERFLVHSPYTSISISKPEKESAILSIYRAGGPHRIRDSHNASFDRWLLSEAQRQGARVENQPVSRVFLGVGAAIEVAGARLEYDLVVLASGVNARPTAISGLRYVPPRTRTMAQDELYAGAAQVESRLGNTAHIFLIPGSGLIFGALVPKGPFINVSVLGNGRLPVSVADFLNQEMVRSLLPADYMRTCGCRPRAVIGPARNYCADRFVAIGDAAVSRLYKDGIGSALLTAREAARTAVHRGLSQRDFELGYQPLCRAIQSDNSCGGVLFSIHDRAKDSRAFLLAQHRLIGDEQDNTSGPQSFTRVTWGMFTGSYSYRAMAGMAFAPASIARLLLAFFRESWSAVSKKKGAYPKRLHVGGKRILILGSGFGGTYTLRNLVHSLNRNENAQITMVSNENFFLFLPLLHEVAMGRIETRHIAYPIRRLHWRDRFEFVLADVEKIDLSSRKVLTSSGTLDFDYLVLALGSTTHVPDLGSVGNNVFTLKTLRDSMLIRNHIIGVFERASLERDPERRRQLLTFVVSGGGYTGIQLVTELRDFIFRSLLRFYKTVDPSEIKVILVEAERKIVAELHTKLGAYVMKHLQQTGIEVRLRSKVSRVTEQGLEINGTEIVPMSTLIWVAGVVANPRVAELDAETDAQGRVMVNEYLEVPGFPGVYAVGDCAHFEDPRSGQPIPPRAHTAVRQAKVVAHNILAEIRGRDKKSYRYANTAEIVSLGASKAVFRFYGLRLYGLAARLIWLVAYASLITGTYNRIRILLDWLLSSLFGRDITLLKLGKQRHEDM
ncbi:MAG: FAD-dependent oxidoreductase [Dehalococcoidia bacterium]|nr:FAD-dependent oxidoreductase [Dehalococcoidia bacterium]